MADGYTDGRAELRLALTERDRDAVESAQRVAGSDAPIVRIRNTGLSPTTGRPTQPMVSWVLYSSEIASRLTALGVVPRKSYRPDVRVPSVVADSSSFWRRLIDGDGTIYWQRRHTGNKVRATGALRVLGGRSLLEQWVSFVVKSIGGPSPQVRPVRGTKILHESGLSAARAWRMLRIMYAQGGPALERKRKVALEILRSPAPQPHVVPIEVVELALDALGNRALDDVPYRYVCPQTGARLGWLLWSARRGKRPDLHELFEKYDARWRSSRPKPLIPIDRVKVALDELGNLPLHEVPDRYRCPRTGVRLGELLQSSRVWRGERPELQALFRTYDAKWRSVPERARKPIPTHLVVLALSQLEYSRLSDVPQNYVCWQTGVRLGRLVSNARRRGTRPDLTELFARHDPQWDAGG